MRTVRTAVAVLALTAVVAGCGRADEGEAVTVVKDLDLMQAAEAGGTSRLSFSMDTTGSTFGGDDGARVHMTFEGEGVIDPSTREARWSATLATRPEAPEGSVDTYVSAPPATVEAIQTHDGSWQRTWSEGEDPSSWMELPSFDDGDDEGDDVSEDEGGGLLGVAVDPTTFLDRLEEAGRVTVVGEDEVRGDTTTRYRAEVDAADLDLGGDEDGPVGVDVWIDTEGRLRKIETEGMGLELWDFGTPLDLTPPTDVAAPDAADWFDDTMPSLTGDWATAATGTTGEAAWTVFAAPGEAYDTPTTCRTLEVDGAGVGGGLIPDGVIPDGATDELPFPVHGTTMATCGNGLMALASTGFTPEPALQVLPAGGGMGVFGSEQNALVGFVVSPEYATSGITLVRRGADPVALELDAAGIGVWDAAGSTPIDGVELADGTVRCTFAVDGDEGAGAFDPGEPMQWVGLVPPVCVAV